MSADKPPAPQGSLLLNTSTEGGWVEAWASSKGGGLNMGVFSLEAE
jgi:hypothetical protein